MSALRRRSATRNEIMRIRRRLERVRMAADLLSRKRSALVNELLRTARPVLDARSAIQWQAALASRALLRAEADRGSALLRALGSPDRELQVELRPSVSWGVVGAEVVSYDPVRRSPDERGTAVASAGPAAAAAATEFETLTELVLEAASRELQMRRLARALSKTSRLLNVLERRVGPALLAERVRIESTLGEREREEQLRYRRLFFRP